MIRLSDLVEGLKTSVPPYNGTPPENAYEQFVKDAVDDFSRRAPMYRVVTLAVHQGTAIYTLPADFSRLIRIAQLTNPGNLLITNQGLIPLTAAYREHFFVAGLKLTIDPVPNYTLDRMMAYAAIHLLDTTTDPDNPAYPDMTSEVQMIASHMCEHNALMAIANKVARNAWRYQVGDMVVDKVQQVREMRNQALEAENHFLELVKSYNGEHGLPAFYGYGEQGPFAQEPLISPYIR